MPDKWIVLLGGNELNAGFQEIASAWDAKLAIVDWNERPALQCDRHIRLDIKAADVVSEAVAELPGEILLAYTSADVASETAAAINSRYGLSRAPAEAIRKAGDKSAMNMAWREAGLLNKAYQLCSTPEKLEAFAKSLGRKLIIKPVDASSSRGVTVVEADEIPHVNWNEIFLHAQEKGASSSVLAEEFIEGTEYTVEMIGDTAGNVEVWGISKKYHTSNTRRNRIAVKLHYNPPDVPRERLERIAEFGAACYRALGLQSSLGHFEVIETPSLGLVPVEMAARSSGFIASHLVSVLSGRPGDYIARYRDVLRGHSVSSGLIPSTRSSMYFFYDPPPGHWTQDGLNLMTLLPGILSLANSRSRLTKGASIGTIDTDNERYGFEILFGDMNALTFERVMAAEQSLYCQAVDPHAGD